MIKYYKKRIERKGGSGKLDGLGHQQLTRQRGLRGSLLGPANEGRKLSPEEKRVIEQQLLKQGLVTKLSTEPVPEEVLGPPDIVMQVLGAYDDKPPWED